MEPMGIRPQAETVFQRMEGEVFRLNNAKGWFDEERSVGDMVALLHSEVSEILEAYRDSGFASNNATTEYMDGSQIVKPQSVAIEMADVLIRLLDMARRWEIDLVAAYDEKMKYNWTRPYRHGRKHL